MKLFSIVALRAPARYREDVQLRSRVTTVHDSIRQTLVLLLLALLALVLTTSLHAQTALPTPEGEYMVSTMVLRSQGSSYRCAATRTTLYVAQSEKSTLWGANTILYSSPLNRKIVDCSFREDSVANSVLVAILLDNGSSEILRIGMASRTLMSRDESYSTPISLSASAPAKKIVLTNQLFVYVGLSVWRNARDGSPWQQDTAGLNRASINDLARGPHDEVLVATFRGIAQWMPESLSWNRKTLNFDSTMAASSVAMISASTIYVGTTNRGTYCTRDSAKSWLSDSVGIAAQSVQRFAYGRGSDMLYAIIAINANTSSLYAKQMPLGVWTRIDSALNLAVQTPVKINGMSADSVVDLATSFGSYTSNDSGRTWQSTTFGIAAEDISALHFISNDELIMSTSLGIYRKRGTWTKVYPSRGFVASRTVNAIRTPELRLYTQLASVGSAQGAILVSNDSGTTWSLDTVGLRAVPVPTGANSGSRLLVDNRGRKFMALSSTLMRMYSSDPWRIDTAGMFLKPSPSGSEISACVYADNDSTIFVGGPLYTGTGSEQKLLDVFLFRRGTTDSLWTQDTIGLDRSPITAMVRSSKGLYAASGIFTGNSQLFKKNGQQWDLLPPNINSFADARTMSVDSSGTIYVAYGHVLPATYQKPERGVWATHDEGKTWDYAGLDSIQVRGLTATSEAMFAYTNRGAYRVTPHSLREAKASFSVHTIDFGDVPVGETRDTTIQLYNNGIDTLFVLSIPSGSQYVHVTPQSCTITSLASHYITISFEPQLDAKVLTMVKPLCVGSTDSIIVRGRGIGPSDVADARSAKLSVYPNPMAETLTIATPDDNELNIKLVDLFGTVVHERRMRAMSTLDLRSLSNGQYTLLWSGAHSSGYVRVIKSP